MTALAVLLALSVADVDPEVPKKAVALLTEYCARCHGKESPRGGVSVLDLDGLRRSAIVPGKPDESQLVLLIEDGSMPPGRSKPPSEEERRLLRKWVEEGAPNVPPPPTFETGDDYALKQIAADWAKNKRPSARYVSLDHLLALPDGPARLAKTRGHLERVLAGLAAPGKKAFKLLPIDKQQSIFRVDLNALGWEKSPFVVKIPPAGPGGKTTARESTLTVFDLFLLEYPLAVVNFKNKLFRDNANFLLAAEQIRPIVYVRGDWLLGLLNDRKFAQEVSLLAGNPDSSKLPAPVPDEIYPAQVPAKQAWAELSWKGAADKLKKALVAEGLDELANGKPVARKLWNEKFPVVVRGLGLGTPILPWDSVTVDQCYDEPALTVEAYTELYKLGKKDDAGKKVLVPGVPLRKEKVFKLVKKGVKPTHGLGLVVKPSRDVFLEIALSDYKLEMDNMYGPSRAGGGKEFRLDDDGCGFEVEPPASEDHFVIFASTGTKKFVGETHRAGGLKGPERLRFKGKVRDRYVHDFYRPSEDYREFKQPAPRMVKLSVTFRSEE